MGIINSQKFNCFLLCVFIAASTCNDINVDIDKMHEGPQPVKKRALRSSLGKPKCSARSQYVLPNIYASFVRKREQSIQAKGDEEKSL